MNKSFPFYKIAISYFNLKDNENSHTEKNIVFQDEKPIDSRKKAIERFRSLEDIFEQAKKNGTVLSSISEIFDRPMTADFLPSLNLYFCENHNEEDDLVLYGSLLENMEERMIELTDECRWYHDNNIHHEGVEYLTDENENTYIVLKDSLFTDEDLEKFN